MVILFGAGNIKGVLLTISAQLVFRPVLQWNADVRKGLQDIFSKGILASDKKGQRGQKGHFGTFFPLRREQHLPVTNNTAAGAYRSDKKVC